MKRLMPYGSANFEEIATGNFYYIDKTMYIEKLENVKFPIFLRPRRFGKSLHTEMLRCYYDLKMKNRFQEIFGKLYIGKNPTGNQNKYFFLKLNFSGMYAYAEMDESELKKSFDEHISGALFGFLINYKDIFNYNDKEIRALKEKYSKDASAAIEDICKMVLGADGKLYLVIDEYDSLTNALAIRYRYSGVSDNMYLKILSKGGFFRNFFEMLKSQTDNVIHQIYMTGILPITISDMKSGFNIASWIQFEEEFADMLGITKTEFDDFIDEVYTDYPNITLSKDEVKTTIKNYYNGYKFTKQSSEVYNPMMTLYCLNSVIKYSRYPDILADNNLRISYDQIAFLFGQNLERAKEIMTQITENKKFNFYSQLQISFDMKDFKEGNYIAEGLFYAGILTYSNTLNLLKIPNLVTYDFTLDYFNELQKFKYESSIYSQWIGAYKQQGDAKALIEGFFKDVIQKFPGQFFSNAYESFYHGLFFHVLYNHTEKDLYEVLPEFNLPHGRVDLMLRTYPNQTYTPCYLHDFFELKQVPKGATNEEFEAEFEKCKQQVLKYKTGDYAHFRAIAVCFRGNAEVKVEIL